MPRGPHHSHRALPQLRHHGPHRCRQDHHVRTHPVLHRRQPQDRRSARRCRDDGLDGAGAGARHHHHVRRDDGVLEGHGQVPAGAPLQHHRHPRPRRLHHRSRAFAARARRRGVRAVRRRRRAAAVRDRVAPGQQVRRAAPCVRQQDGPHRRRLRQGRRAAEVAPGRVRRCRCRCRSAPKTASRAWSTCSR